MHHEINPAKKTQDSKNSVPLFLQINKKRDVSECGEKKTCPLQTVFFLCVLLPYNLKLPLKYLYFFLRFNIWHAYYAPVNKIKSIHSGFIYILKCQPFYLCVEIQPLTCKLMNELLTILGNMRWRDEFSFWGWTGQLLPLWCEKIQPGWRLPDRRSASNSPRSRQKESAVHVTKRNLRQ